MTAGFNKPNKQTILPLESIPKLFDDLAISKVKSMGGKLGEEVCAKLNVKTMSDLLKFSEVELQTHFQSRVGSWLYLMARGIELEKVTPKFMSKSIAVSKNFRGKNEISSCLTLKYWLKELANEIVERLEKDALDCNRTSRNLIVGFTQGPENSNNNNVASTRTIPLNGKSLNSYTAEQIADEAFDMIKKNSTKFLKAEGTVLMSLNIKHLAITAGKFEDNNPPGQVGASSSLQALLKNHKKAEPKASVTQMAESSSNSKSRCAALDMLKKFEMKSPKGMGRNSEDMEVSSKPDQLIPPAVPPQAPFQLTSSETFVDEFSIKGLSTLKHWIGVLVEKLCMAIEIDSTKNKRSPKVFILKFKQAVGSDKVEDSMSFNLTNFKDKIIDVEIIIEAMKQSKSFLGVEGKICKPIVQLEICATEFESEKCWEFAVSNSKPVPAVFFNEVPRSSVTEEVVGNSEDEEETCVSCEDNTDEIDKDLGEYLRAELEDINRREVAAIAANEVNSEGSPEPDDFEETAENLPEDLASASPERERVVQQVTVEPNQPRASYLQTYAEFNPDPLLLELLNPKEECPDCGKMIAKLDLVSHLDRHLAFQISNEQRLEFRSQKRTSGSPLTSNQPISKKTAKAKPRTIKTPVNSIEKYAVKKSEAGDTVPGATEGMTKCEDCQKYIPTAEKMSHRDYHLAKNLRAENLKTTPTVEPKRKRPASAQKIQPKMKSMKSYFSAD